MEIMECRNIEDDSEEEAMNTLLFCVVVVVSVAVSRPTMSWAQAAPQEEAQEKELKSSAAAMDQEASKPEGAKKVTQRLEQDFGVEEGRITALREKKLGFGEVHHVLSLAQQLPGGITDENVNKILTMRQEQKMGWGKIAQGLGVKLGPAVNRNQHSAAPSETATSDESGAPSAAHPGHSRGSSETNSQAFTDEQAEGVGSHHGGTPAGMSHVSPQPAFGAHPGNGGNGGHAPGQSR